MLVPTISTIGCDPGEVDTFDSGSPLLKASPEMQIAALLCTKMDTTTVRYVTTLNH